MLIIKIRYPDICPLVCRLFFVFCLLTFSLSSHLSRLTSHAPCLTSLLCLQIEPGAKACPTTGGNQDYSQSLIIFSVFCPLSSDFFLHVPRPSSHVSCPMSHVSCLTSVFCPLSSDFFPLVSCLTSHVSCFTSHAPCLFSFLCLLSSSLTSHVLRPLSYAPCLSSLVCHLSSDFCPLVYRPMSHVSRLASHFNTFVAILYEITFVRQILKSKRCKMLQTKWLLLTYVFGGYIFVVDLVPLFLKL